MAVSKILPVLAAAALASQAGCKHERGEIDGIAEYQLGVTTVADGVVCTPRESYTWCSNNPKVAIGGQAATVDLYFDGKEKTSTAVEILLTVSNCKEEPILESLKKELGQPTQSVGARWIWRGKKAVIVAQLPAEPGTCEINFLHPSQTERIEKLTSPRAD